jgi:KDO2-lipid IV(A) lauroyltransferase
LKYRLEYLVMKAFLGFLASRGSAGRVAWGRRIGRILYRLDGKHRRLAIDNITRGLGVGGERAEAIARNNFEHLGLNMAEFAVMGRRGGDDSRVTIEGLEGLARARSGGRGAFLLSGHFGNWELCASTLSQSLPLTVVARPMKNPLSEKLIRERREGSGMKVVGHRNSTKQILKCVAEGGVVAVLLDQNTHHREAVFVNFLGRPASVNFGLALLAAKTGAAVLPGFMVREEALRHRGYIGDPIELARRKDRKEELGVNSARFTAALEGFVRRYPEQWFWVHNRWKNQPRPGDRVYEP